MKRKNKAVFLDRDGVINEKPPAHNYVKKWEEFKFLPNVAKAIRRLNKNFLVIVITNQRGVGRGLMTLNDLKNIHKQMEIKLLEKGARIDAIYFCPHNIEDNCQCRKPKPGMLFEAAKDFKINLSQSYIIGDDAIDIQTGKAADCKIIFFSNSLKKFSQADYVAADLLEAVRIIEREGK